MKKFIKSLQKNRVEIWMFSYTIFAVLFTGLGIGVFFIGEIEKSFLFFILGSLSEIKADLIEIKYGQTK